MRRVAGRRHAGGRQVLADDLHARLDHLRQLAPGHGASFFESVAACSVCCFSRIATLWLEIAIYFSSALTASVGALALRRVGERDHLVGIGERARHVGLAARLVVAQRLLVGLQG